MQVQKPLIGSIKVLSCQQNKSSRMSSRWMHSECSFLSIPLVVIMVTMTFLSVFVVSMNVETLRSMSSSSLAVIVYGLFQNFISQILIVLSARSMSMSICAERRSPLPNHEKTLAVMPDIPSAFLIWSTWFKHNISNARKRSQMDCFFYISDRFRAIVFKKRLSFIPFFCKQKQPNKCSSEVANGQAQI